MSRETWLLMVKVARQKLAKALWQTPPRRKRTQRASLAPRSVREDHYAMLLAAQY